MRLAVRSSVLRGRRAVVKKVGRCTRCSSIGLTGGNDESLRAGLQRHHASLDRRVVPRDHRPESVMGDAPVCPDGRPVSCALAAARLSLRSRRTPSAGRPLAVIVEASVARAAESQRRQDASRIGPGHREASPDHPYGTPPVSVWSDVTGNGCVSRCGWPPTHRSAFFAQYSARCPAR